MRTHSSMASPLVSGDSYTWYAMRIACTSAKLGGDVMEIYKDNIQLGGDRMEIYKDNIQLGEM